MQLFLACLCIFLHFCPGCLMLIAWMVFASFGMLMPRYFKSAWPYKTWCGKKIWFQVSSTCIVGLPSTLDYPFCHFPIVSSLRETHSFYIVLVYLTLQIHLLNIIFLLRWISIKILVFSVSKSTSKSIAFDWHCKYKTKTWMKFQIITESNLFTLLLCRTCAWSQSIVVYTPTFYQYLSLNVLKL